MVEFSTCVIYGARHKNDEPTSISITSEGVEHVVCQIGEHEVSAKEDRDNLADLFVPNRINKRDEEEHHQRCVDKRVRSPGVIAASGKRKLNVADGWVEEGL